MFDADGSESFDDLGSLFGTGNASRHAESFDYETHAFKLSPRWKLEAKLTLIDVECVEGDAGTGRDLGLDISMKSPGVVVVATGEFDVVTSGKNSRVKTGLGGCGGHTSDHDWGFTTKGREARSIWTLNR